MFLLTIFLSILPNYVVVLYGTYDFRGRICTGFGCNLEACFANKSAFSLPIIPIHFNHTDTSIHQGRETEGQNFPQLSKVIVR